MFTIQTEEEWLAPKLALAKSNFESEVRLAKAEYKRLVEAITLLDEDPYLMSFLRGGPHGQVPVAAVLASTYGVSPDEDPESLWGRRKLLPIEPYNEMMGIDVPVVMRGSKVTLGRKYGATDLCIRLMARYLRLIKYTEIDRKQIVEFIHDLHHMAATKVELPYQSNPVVLREFIGESGARVYYFDGVPHFPIDGDADNEINRMFSLVEKIDRNVVQEEIA